MVEAKLGSGRGREVRRQVPMVRQSGAEEQDEPKGVGGLFCFSATEGAQGLRYGTENMPNEERGGTTALVVAIDGPAGAGKSTVAKETAKRLHYRYVDTGAMYRAVTLAAIERGADVHEEQQMAAVAATLAMEFRTGPHGKSRLWLEGRDVTWQIRSPRVEAQVSHVAAYPSVREQMVRLQRELARAGGVVLDGRDIGTFVCPAADCKFFLTASLEVRARRRLRQLRRQGHDVTFDRVRADMMERDRQDSERQMAPLEPAVNAIVIDTTSTRVAEVVDRIVSICRTVEAKKASQA